jgi:holo-[acyl-carrier protein] synthase
MGVRVGIDMVSIDAVQESISVHAGRYLGRVYTSVELAECRLPGGGADARRLAARFAAKEAVLKLLRVDEGGVPWRSIGVRRDARGRARIQLSGAAQTLATENGITSIDVSLSHAAGFAAAVVVAEVPEET